MTLSKSDYMSYLKHPAYLWLRKNARDRLPPIDAATQAMFDAGHRFETYAEELYPDPVRIGFTDYEEYRSLPKRTEQALQDGAQTILQGGFKANNVICIVDILNRIEQNTYDLIEVKSSTKVKPEHEFDVAFQLLVLEKCGLNIRNVSILHVNKDYMREGDVEPEKLTEQTDITGAVHQLRNFTLKHLKQAFTIARLDTMPEASPRYVNHTDIPSTRWFSEWMDIYLHLHPDLHPYSIYFLSYPNQQQLADLEDKHIDLIKDVPEEMALREKQRLQIKTTRESERVVDKEKIKQFLDTFEFPLYFLDYETLSSVIPAFDGYQPYKDYPFQYSLHMLDEPGGELVHKEYIHEENTDPVPALLERLQEDVGDEGTVLTWNMSYEKMCNDIMARSCPEYGDFLDGLNERINDLMIPFSEMWFVDKDFYGSASLKNVLPVLAPDLLHQDLDISDGMQARREWMDTVLDGVSEDKKAKVLGELSEYCTLDTYGMVRIWEELRGIEN